MNDDDARALASIGSGGGAANNAADMPTITRKRKSQESDEKPANVSALNLTSASSFNDSIVAASSASNVDDSHNADTDIDDEHHGAAIASTTTTSTTAAHNDTGDERPAKRRSNERVSTSVGMRVVHQPLCQLFTCCNELAVKTANNANSMANLPVTRLIGWLID